jgi:hypothetical protein
MSSNPRTYALAWLAGLAIAATAAGNAFAQQQGDQDRRDQPESQDQSDQSQQQADDQDRQNTGQANAQNEQQQRQSQESQRQQQQRQQQQRAQSQNRDQSRWNDSEGSSNRQWEQPNDSNYGSDSLRYERGNDRDSNRGSQQGGLGVGLKSDGSEGVVVAQVNSGSPADEMGIRPNDRITAVNGRQVQSVQQFIARIRNMEPGEKIELDIRRASGGEQTVRGELETRNEALSEDGQRSGQFNQSGERWSYGAGGRFSQQDRRNRQTSYDEQRGSSPSGSAQRSNQRLEQIERQVNRLSREIDDLRIALQSIRRDSGQPTQWNRERTARYEEYQGTTGQREYDGRFDGQGTYRETDRDSRSAGRDSTVDTPGGETGEDRLHVGSEDARE